MGNANNCNCNNALCSNEGNNMHYNNNSEILENDCYEDIQIEEPKKKNTNENLIDNKQKKDPCVLNENNSLVNSLGVVPENKNENDSSMNNNKMIFANNNSNKNIKTKQIIESFKSSNINILRKAKTKNFASFNIKSVNTLNIATKNKKYLKSEIIKSNLKVETNNIQVNDQILNKPKDNKILEKKAEETIKEKLSEKKINEIAEEKNEKQNIVTDELYNNDINKNNMVKNNTYNIFNNFTSSKNTENNNNINYKNNNSSNKKNIKNIIINRNEKRNNLFIKKQNLTKNSNNIIKNNMLNKNPKFKRNKKNSFVSYNSNENVIHFTNFSNYKESNTKNLQKLSTNNVSDIENIMSKEQISKLTDTDIICSDNLEKIIKVPEKNKVIYNQRFCLLTKKYFSYYMSKGCFLQLDKPLFRVENKNIKRIEQIYLGEDTYFFAIICEINDETRHYIDKINSFASMGENGTNEFLLGFRTSDIDLTIKWIILLNYFIMNHDENQKNEN